MADETDPSRAPGCPRWCVTGHDPARGEDDWLHQSEPLSLADGVVAVLCLSVDPRTGERDGPWVVIGDRQYTPGEAERLGLDLSALARAEEGPRAADERRSPGP